MLCTRVYLNMGCREFAVTSAPRRQPGVMHATVTKLLMEPILLCAYLAHHVLESVVNVLLPACRQQLLP